MPSDDRSTDARIDRLEARIEELEKRISELGADQEPSPDEQDGADKSSADRLQHVDEPGDPRAVTGSGGAETDRENRRPASTESDPWILRSVDSASLRSEDWLNYVGIALLLFGLGFLFKYSVEQGWLVPEVRVGFGVLTGTVLLGGGLRIYRERRRLRQILLGGSSAVYYGTIFAAYHLYALVSYPVAFASMVLVTVLSIAVALKQDHASMAVIGTLGGLGTPFLLYGDVGAVGGVSVYVCIVLAGACAVYLARGWPSLVYATVSVGWVVLLVPCLDAALTGDPPAGLGLLQGTLAVSWLLLGGTPVLRAVLRARRPHQWPNPAAPVFEWYRVVFGSRPVYGLVGISPFALLVAFRLLRSGTTLLWVGGALVGTLVYGAASFALRRMDLTSLSEAHALTAALFGTYALGEALGDPLVLVGWALQAWLLLALSRRLDLSIFRTLGHLLFGLVGLWLVLRFLMVEPTGPVGLRTSALVELLVLGIAAAASWWPRSSDVKGLYRGVVLAGWLGWWMHHLHSLVYGQAYISIAWGGTAAVLLGFAVGRRRPWGGRAGLAVLLLFVGKLFLVDLATLPALWRIVLFLGAGATFLLIGYSVPGFRHASPSVPHPFSEGGS